MRSPQPQRCIEDRAPIQVWMRRHMRVHGCQQVGIQRSSDLGPPSDGRSTSHTDSVPDILPDTTFV